MKGMIGEESFLSGGGRQWGIPSAALRSDGVLYLCETCAVAVVKMSANSDRVCCSQKQNRRIEGEIEHE